MTTPQTSATTVPAYRRPAPGADKFKHTNATLEDFLRHRNSGNHLNMKPQNISAARQGLDEWHEAPDRNCFRRSGPGGSATSHLWVRLTGAGVPGDVADEVITEEIEARFG